MSDKLGSISNETITTATGKSWEEWIDVIDNFGGAEMSHKEIAAKLLDEDYLESGWWAQSVTVGYEYAKGRRVKGETKDTGFQIGVQKTLPASQQAMWDFLMSPAGWEIWLGEVEGLKIKKGVTYQTKDGITGEIRSVASDEKLRLTWQPKGRSAPTTLQITLLSPQNAPDKTSVHFHQEKLAGSEEREAMKQHWQEVLGKLEASSNK